MPVVADPRDFDSRSGSLLERLIFNNRRLVMLTCAIVTVVLAVFAAIDLRFNASFETMLPQHHPFIQNYLKNRDDLPGLGNAIRVVVENKDGTIFDKEYLDVLQKMNDALFLMPGINRPWVKSLWTPAVRWTEVTEEGFEGGPVMPPTYDGGDASLELLRRNISRADIVGNLVGKDFKSSMIFLPLMEHDPATGGPLDYGALSQRIETIRSTYQGVKGEGPAHGRIAVHVIGFAKLVGDLIDGLKQVLLFFGIAALIAAGIIYHYTRCIRSTVLVITCSLIAVLWQIGLVAALGFRLDPFSILVPFLVFAIGVSHGAQKMNGIMQDVGRGTHRLVAARYTFRRLFLAGLTALLADAVGFAVLIIIDIPVIRDLALTASLGVAVLIFTNLVLLPVLLSYIGVSPSAAARSLRGEREESSGKGFGRIWFLLDKFTTKRWATAAVLVSAVVTIAGFVVGLQLKTGDLDPGAPELRPDSRYNRDNAYIAANYGLSSDQFAILVRTPVDGCQRWETLLETDRLAWELRQLPSVKLTSSLPDGVRRVTSGTYEGDPKWLTLARNQDVLNYGTEQTQVVSAEALNQDCSLMPLVAYLTDHKAETLDQVVAVSERFVDEHRSPDRQFLLAAGSAGIEAATNIVVHKANRTMLLEVYGAVILLCFVTFRSWRAVVVAVVPLAITSILCEALMVMLGIGVKVATLPVIALGVGIGVDYALYLLSVQLARQRAGVPLREAYRQAVQFTGRVVALVGVTLAAGVVTWAFSAIKFQADMGILLTFMFLENMVGALVLIPALSYFLLNDKVMAAK
jgi:predicted RND superfamily exporter protein